MIDVHFGKFINNQTYFIDGVECKLNGSAVACGGNMEYASACNLTLNQEDVDCEACKEILGVQTKH